MEVRRVEISKKSNNIGNDLEKGHKCLILMINLKVSKQTRSEASRNKVIIKRVSNISINISINSVFIFIIYIYHYIIMYI